jgi:hypothetical protein
MLNVSKYHLLKAWSTSVVPMGDGGTFGSWDLARGPWVIGGMPLKELWTVPLPFPLFAFWLYFILHTCSLPWCATLPQAQSISTNQS